MTEIEIPMSGRKYAGLVARIDEEDLDLVQGHRWFVSRSDDKLYAIANVWENGIHCSPIKMHRLIAGAIPGVDVDHIDRDGLNNTRANLRTATRSQNNANARKRRGRYSSVYKGSHWHKGAGKWQAEISKEGTTAYLGLHDSDGMAGMAYDCAARILFGEFARLNFPDVHEYPFTFEQLSAKRQTSSRYVGVAFNKRAGKWTARIKRDGKLQHLGTFATEEEAYRARFASAALLPVKGVA